MTAKASLTASTLRWILLASIIVLIAGGIAGAVYLQGMLNAQMGETNKIEAEAINNSDNLARAQALRGYLEKHQDDVNKTAGVVANTVAYQYQDQIMQDINRYADLSGVRILGFDFHTSKSTKSATSGLMSYTATITLDKPIAFRNYLTFLKYIEQNLTKMQITTVSIEPDSKNPNLINNPSIGLEVYAK